MSKQYKVLYLTLLIALVASINFTFWSTVTQNQFEIIDYVPEE